jgi:hypothetical protein
VENEEDVQLNLAEMPSDHTPEHSCTQKQASDKEFNDREQTIEQDEQTLQKHVITTGTNGHSQQPNKNKSALQVLRDKRTFQLEQNNPHRKAIHELFDSCDIRTWNETWFHTQKMKLKDFPGLICTASDEVVGIRLKNSSMRGTVPKNINILRLSLQILDLADNKIRHIPETIGELTTLTELDLSDNRLTEIPNSVGNLTKLQLLDISRQRKWAGLSTPDYSEKGFQNPGWFYMFTTIPPTVGNLSQLTSFLVSHNEIAVLPDSIGGLRSLQILKVEGNQLSALPDSISNLTQLKQLHVGENSFPNSLQMIEQLVNLRQVNLFGSNFTINRPKRTGDLQLQWANGR